MTYNNPLTGLIICVNTNPHVLPGASCGETSPSSTRGARCCGSAPKKARPAEGTAGTQREKLKARADLVYRHAWHPNGTQIVPNVCFLNSRDMVT